jgi:FAD:protein FMN transferase
MAGPNRGDSSKSLQYILYFFLMALALISPQECVSQQYKSVKGYAQGSSYAVQYDGNSDLEGEFDKIFLEIDTVFSLWNKNAVIYKINHNRWKANVPIKFSEIYLLSKKIKNKTGGYLEPSLYPLLDYYGFYGKKSRVYQSPPLKPIGKIRIDSKGLIVKKDSLAGFDFNAIVQGYTVDLVAELLLSYDIKNFLIEIGGETRASGLNPKGKTWKIGVEDPDSEEHTLRNFELRQMATATSGHYSNTKTMDGKNRSHVFNPKKLEQTHSDILSVTVFHESCAWADAYATALLSMGFEKSKKYAKQLHFSAFWIYQDKKNNTKTYYFDSKNKN